MTSVSQYVRSLAAIEKAIVIVSDFKSKRMRQRLQKRDTSSCLE